MKNNLCHKCHLPKTKAQFLEPNLCCYTKEKREYIVSLNGKESQIIGCKHCFKDFLDNNACFVSYRTTNEDYEEIHYSKWMQVPVAANLFKFFYRRKSQAFLKQKIQNQFNPTKQE